MNMSAGKDRYSTWVEIDLNAIERNARYFRERTGRQVMAVVKANAYGHGAVAVARAALAGGASWLAVARFEEASELRQAGLECPILLLGYTPTGQWAEAINRRISLTIWDSGQVEAASALAQQAGEPARLHLKVDTGMSRLGIQPQYAAYLARQIARTPGVVFEGLFTHFARADESHSTATNEQEDLFQSVILELESLGLRPAFVHAANSAASLSRPSAWLDLVRAGISLYGLRPSPLSPFPSELRPALSWKTVLSQVKVLPAGRGVSYGHLYTTSGQERIGTLPVGYADGFRRVAGNQVLVGGRRAPVIGRVCMDQVMVQLDGIQAAQTGDEVVILGQQGDERISAEEIGERWGTINYEVVCGIGARVPRIYY